jgi:hypothetical protein
MRLIYSKKLQKKKMILRIIGKEKKYHWIVKLQKITKQRRTNVHLKKGEIPEMKLTLGHTLLQKVIRRLWTMYVKWMRIWVSLFDVVWQNDLRVVHHVVTLLSHCSSDLTLRK